MNLSSDELLRRLGSGQTIADACSDSGLTADAFDTWWRSEIRQRVAPTSGELRHSVDADVEIARDARGIPHIFATNQSDLTFGLGYAMAQDRLFQLDYLRRRAAGRLAEILGRTAFDSDLLVRTVGIRRIAESEWHDLPMKTRAALESFTRGVNAYLKDCHALPIEFDLLGYRPESWDPIDSLAIEGEFRWYLTGRMWVIALPELARRELGDGPLLRFVLQRESDAASIIEPGDYPTNRRGNEPVSPARGQPTTSSRATTRPDHTNSESHGIDDDRSPQGSNNWVIAGSRTASGLPLLASDPHIAIEAVSCWYPVHLCGASINVAGMAYAGMPAVMFGRTQGVAWGCTNNICSQRDLYQERTDPAHPDCYLYDGAWEPARRLEETIAIRSESPIRKTILFSRNGPIVDEVLPKAARDTGPVSLRWMGAHAGGWLTALLAMNRAESAAELQSAMEPWCVPTFSVVSADVDGHIGYQATGRIPIREVAERGYRPGWDPAHQWNGVIPFRGMPNVMNPSRGCLITANHRPAPDDFPYPLSGTWLDDLRARRIGTLLDNTSAITRDDFIAMQLDCVSQRAIDCLPGLLSILGRSTSPRADRAIDLLASWDRRLTPESTAAAIFEVFFARWSSAVVEARFAGETAKLIVTWSGGIASHLLRGDDSAGWFAGDRDACVRRTFHATLDELESRFGPDWSSWTWGKLHTLTLRHWLSSRGDLGRLLDTGGVPVRGDSSTVCNTGAAPDFTCVAGCGYRLVADLADDSPRLWAVDAQSQSGNPGSAHYADQLTDWLAGRLHCLPLDAGQARATCSERLMIRPTSSPTNCPE